MKPSQIRTLLAAVALSLLATGPGQAQSRARRNRPAAAATPIPTPTPAPALASQDQELSPPMDKGTAILGPDAPTSETEILAMQGAQFSAKERVAIFTGDVRVTDPRFQLACDEFTVYLKKTSAAKPGSAPAPDGTATPPPVAAATPAPESSDDNQSAMGGGIDHAIAKGHVIIVQERPATDGGDPKRSVGRGERADFDNNTGDMVLHGLPSVEQNSNTHVATSENTVMTLRRDNSLVTKGPSRTLIIQRKTDTPPGAPGATPAASPHR